MEYLRHPGHVQGTRIRTGATSCLERPRHRRRCVSRMASNTSGRWKHPCTHRRDTERLASSSRKASDAEAHGDKAPAMARGAQPTGTAGVELELTAEKYSFAVMWMTSLIFNARSLCGQSAPPHRKRHTRSPRCVLDPRGRPCRLEPRSSLQ